MNGRRLSTIKSKLDNGIKIRFSHLLTETNQLCKDLGELNIHIIPLNNEHDCDKRKTDIERFFTALNTELKKPVSDNNNIRREDTDPIEEYESVMDTSYNFKLSRYQTIIINFSLNTFIILDLNRNNKVMTTEKL